jgi:hypothetical protein
MAVEMHKRDPSDDLARARAAVLEQLPDVPASLRPPAIAAGVPLRVLPPALEARLAARAAAGLSALGTEHPRGSVWQRVVLPSGLFAVVDALGAGVAALDGHPVLALVAGVLFVPFAGLAVGGWRFGARDPLRLSTDDRRTVNNASHWESPQVWAGPLSDGRERALVVVATRAAMRIAHNPSWRGGHLDDHRLRLDLAGELDQVDAQAFRIATARAAGSRSRSLDSAWDAVLTRVAALAGYADRLGEVA